MTNVNASREKRVKARLKLPRLRPDMQGYQHGFQPIKKMHKLQENMLMHSVCLFTWNNQLYHCESIYLCF